MKHRKNVPNLELICVHAKRISSYSAHSLSLYLHVCFYLPVLHACFSTSQPFNQDVFDIFMYNFVRLLGFYDIYKNIHNTQQMGGSNALIPISNIIDTRYFFMTRDALEMSWYLLQLNIHFTIQRGLCLTLVSTNA